MRKDQNKLLYENNPAFFFCEVCRDYLQLDEKSEHDDPICLYCYENLPSAAEELAEREAEYREGCGF